MPRPNTSDEKRKTLLPIVARAFAELGYRGATTAKLARRCKVQENILYRIWTDKKAMFIDAIDYVYEQAADTWRHLLAESDDNEGAAVRLLKYEAEHYGESRLQRIIFAGLSETDEPEIREALRTMYARFHRFIRAQVVSHRDGRGSNSMVDESIAAWGIIGLGNLANIGRELGLLGDRSRQKMFAEAGRLLLDGKRK